MCTRVLCMWRPEAHVRRLWTVLHLTEAVSLAGLTRLVMSSRHPAVVTLPRAASTMPREYSGSQTQVLMIAQQALSN